MIQISRMYRRCHPSQSHHRRIGVTESKSFSRSYNHSYAKGQEAYPAIFLYPPLNEVNAARGCNTTMKFEADNDLQAEIEANHGMKWDLNIVYLTSMYQRRRDGHCKVYLYSKAICWTIVSVCTPSESTINPERDRYLEAFAIQGLC